VPYARNGAVELYYERLNAGGEGPLLLINGLGGQVGGFGFPPGFTSGLADAGLDVVLFDNRDCGLSTELSEAGPVDFAAVAGGGKVPIPYTVHDLADDAIAVLDELAIERAHFLGVSMGGFIARWAAIDHPERVASLILHVTGAAAPAGQGPQLSEEAAARFIEGMQPKDRETAVESAVTHLAWLWGSGMSPPSEDVLRAEAKRSHDRAYRPLGTQRQLLSTLATPGLLEAQARITCPALVIQGTEDPCFPMGHGQSIAETIPGADLCVVDGLGHATPPEFWEPFTQRILEQVRSVAAA
jgi:pimeloyl-ACP methyl ester carboxylesterase